MRQGRRYRILGTLGRGGFGTVYRADLLGESGFTRQVALKVLNPEMENVATVASRLRDEARLLGLLRHRAIVDVDGLVRLDGRWTVVMEYIEGADIHKILSQGPMPQGPALEVIGEVSGALHAAYTQPGPSGEPLRLLHRDIKPQNVVVTPHGEVKVLDFGVARADFAGREAKTKAMLFGSLGYMAPERFDRREGPAADVFALGLLLFEMVTAGEFGRASPKPEKFETHRRGKLDTLAAADGVHPEVAGFVELMTRFDPAERPTAREVERRCRDLRVEVRGQWLRDWAEHAIPPLVTSDEDLEAHDFSSDIVTESQYVAGDLDGGWPDDEPTEEAPVKRSQPTFDGLEVPKVPDPEPGRSLPTYPPEDDEEDDLAEAPPALPPQPPLAASTLEQAGVSRTLTPEAPPPPEPDIPELPATPSESRPSSSRAVMQFVAILGVPATLMVLGLAFVFVMMVVACCLGAATA